MKKVYILIVFALSGMAVLAQGNSGKARGQGNGNGKGKKETVIQNGNSGGVNNGQGKFSKNQPAKVTVAFQRDYPYAKNVTWSKYKGDWTATFGNGPFRSTAVYHANGERRDTRTGITRRDLPGDATVWDRILNRNKIRQDNITRIELPNNNNLIFRMLTETGTAMFFNNQGQSVNYDY